MNNRFLRLNTTTGEINVLVNNLVSFQPSGEGSSIRIGTGDAIEVTESCRTIRSQLKKFDKTVTTDPVVEGEA